jgi:hypothetical protein
VNARRAIVVAHRLPVSVERKEGRWPLFHYVPRMARCAAADWKERLRPVLEVKPSQEARPATAGSVRVGPHPRCGRC